MNTIKNTQKQTNIDRKIFTILKVKILNGKIITCQSIPAKYLWRGSKIYYSRC